jgi:hypothetical protein
MIALPFLSAENPTLFGDLLWYSQPYRPKSNFLTVTVFGGGVHSNQRLGASAGPEGPRFWPPDPVRYAKSGHL